MKPAKDVGDRACKLITLILNSSGDKREEVDAALTELKDIFLNLGGTVVAWTLVKNNIITEEHVRDIEHMVSKELSGSAGDTVH